MSDKIKLMPCVCGGECVQKNKRATVQSYCHCKNCGAGTPIYPTEVEAAEAWNKMQMALKPCWTSEVPTGDGEYMFVGKYIHGGRVYRVNKPTYTKVFTFSDRTRAVPCGNYSYDIKTFDGLWFHINYPEPPEEDEE